MRPLYRSLPLVGGNLPILSSRATVIKKLILPTLFLAFLNPFSVLAASIDTVKFSIDPASPAIAGGITPDDVLTAGPTVYTPGTSLGLKDDFATGNYDNLDALSYGQDGFGDPRQTKLYFSVDRVAVGRPGTAVYEQARLEEAAGDVFFTIPGSGTNSLYIDEERLGLTPGFFGDDLDALDINDSPAPFTYFSIDRFSASNGSGSSDLANDIFKSLGDGSYSIYASGESDIGLDPKDNLDALVLWDVFEPGILNPGIDKALFSLDSFSPNTFTATGNPYQPGVSGALSPADILFTNFTGGFRLWASAADIGLQPDDELDALDVPEPATLALISIGLFVLGAIRKKFRTMLLRRP